uniref:Uncharacterized protein n=1 Tax=Ascaris lumbricoides TaxID=6252 RepID=A0A0M3HRR0_ASCLU
MSLLWLITAILLVLLLLMILGFWHEYTNEVKVQEERRLSPSRTSETKIESEKRNEHNIEKSEDEMIPSITPSEFNKTSLNFFPTKPFEQ